MFPEGVEDAGNTAGTSVAFDVVPYAASHCTPHGLGLQALSFEDRRAISYLQNLSLPKIHTTPP